VIWALWNVRNDVVLNKQTSQSFLQVIPITIHWICTWSYLQWSSGMPWILGATDWRWQHGISIIGVVGGLSTELHTDVSSAFSFFLFRWLIHVSTLCDP
jgi:hypothetical protein